MPYYGIIQIKIKKIAVQRLNGFSDIKSKIT